MKPRRMSIKMFDHERRFLEQSYLRRRITIEQYEVRQDDLHALASEWRTQFQRVETDEQILHFMRTRRKRSLWPRLDGAHEPAPVLPVLTAEQKEVLVDIYYEHVADLGNGSDNIAYEPEVTAMISTEFHHRTGKELAGGMLVGILTAMRKRGMLPKVRKQSEEDIEGFDDINLVG